MLGSYARPRPGPKLTRDEELGKRDDDFRPKTKHSLLSTILTPSKWRKRRIFFALVAGVLLYLFVHNIPSDLGTIDQRIEALRAADSATAQGPTIEPKDVPPKPRGDILGRYYYDGPVKFYRLAPSLREGSKNGGLRPTNSNIMFAASSLKSIANLMPLACEMASLQRNWVHMAVMGRENLPLDTLLEINGVKVESCPVYFHDARPDYADFSTESRAETAAAGAWEHLHYYLHPQAVIMDDSIVEDPFFTRALRDKIDTNELPLIELPADKYEDFMWMTRLDARSIASWFRPAIDILIQASPEGAGNLIRLMKSLEAADYSGLRIPKITVELPSTYDDFAIRYLEGLTWPPEEISSPLQTKTLTLRHRIPSSRISSEEASIRFLESFYPISAADHHVLVLSTQAEVSPLYLHYLLYMILEYKFSSYDYNENAALFGFSLNIPTTFVNGTGDFPRPTLAHMADDKYTTNKKIDTSQPAFFTSHTVSASASLILGEKWMELHNFVSNRLAASHSGLAQKLPKLVAETEPAWLEYALELSRARGWLMLHPPTSYATVHNELARIPEEHARPRKSSTSETDTAELERLTNEPYLLASEPPTVKTSIEHPLVEDWMPLHRTMPFAGDLPELPHVPFISYDGHVGDVEVREDLSEAYSTYFRTHIGGCLAKDLKTQITYYEQYTDDLFCFPGRESDSDDDTELDAKVPGAGPLTNAEKKPIQDIKAAAPLQPVQLKVDAAQLPPAQAKIDAAKLPPAQPKINAAAPPLVQPKIEAVLPAQPKIEAPPLAKPPAAPQKVEAPDAPPLAQHKVEPAVPAQAKADVPEVPQKAKS